VPLAWAHINRNRDKSDRFYPIERAVAEAVGKDVLPVSEDPGKLVQLLNGVAGKVDDFLNYGIRDFNTYEVNGASLKAILSPVADCLDGFRAFAASLRA